MDFVFKCVCVWVYECVYSQLFAQGEYHALQLSQVQLGYARRAAAAGTTIVTAPASADASITSVSPGAVSPIGLVLGQRSRTAKK